MQNPLVNLLDSYKYSHAQQYPKNMVSMYDYMESRGGTYPATVFVGLSYYIQEYLLKPISISDVNKARDKAKAHGIPFDYEGWCRIVFKHRGLFPVEIKAVPEGSLIPTGHPLLTIESTDPEIPWVAGALETLLMKIWYPTTIATKSFYTRKLLEKYGSPEWAQFAYHNFGDRGATSVEAAAIGGFAHLTQFMGTDNFNSLFLAEDFYRAKDVAGYSVYATEHSSTTSHGKNGEAQFVLDQLRANPNALIMSFVADSYDPYAFTDMCTHPDSEIRKLLESRPRQKLVLRPDSGKPIEVIERMLLIMSDNEVETVFQENGQTLFKQFGILWGDGITPETIEAILETMTAKGFAAENFVFGSGGDLMQNVTRDTQKFAIKCSSITTATKFDESMGHDRSVLKEINVFKDPITDPGKASKKGKVTTYIDSNGEYSTGLVDDPVDPSKHEALQTVYRNGTHIVQPTLEEIRACIL